ncbi:putative quinol monooxygenase [Saccharopolyspora sp. MS10]|uniref:putative quinol monooxygenase n=1 Tax=Saccharopolyspora sp. MS10 TaxID=3385973 RepID=UPI0039A0CED1
MTGATESGGEVWAVARVKLHEGKLEDFKRAAARCQERTRAEDTGTLRYEIYLNADESECVLIEGYRDVDALIEHNANLGDLLPAMLGTGSVSAELLGHFSDEFKQRWQGEPVRFLDAFA